MAIRSKIEWTDSTWNPVTGCTKISPGCEHCYAKTFAERWRGIPGHPYEQGFDLRLWESRLGQPRKWKKPRRIFVNSMSDLFHKDVPPEFIDRVFDAIRDAPWHTFQILTKRSSRLRAYVNSREWKIPGHVWLGVSVENAAAVVRVKHLRETRAPNRFLSVEPLLGPLPSLNLVGIGWVIVGGESGPGFRKMELDWARSVRDDCKKFRVPFFFKQHSAFRPKELGCKLDGIEWKQFPPEVSEQLSL